tara:strand:+ start:37857 stop:38339 length:483 start_codon:yes stop_codon:yes gene_type:complete
MPDGDLIKTLRNAGWGFFVLAAIGLGGVAVVWRFIDAPSTDVQGYIEAGAIGSSIIGGALLVWRATAKNRSLGRFFAKQRLYSGFDKLTDQQKKLLVDVYRTGERNFDVPTGMSSKRYFEELVERGFVESVDLLIWSTGQTTWPYKLTTISWEVVKKKTP